MGCKNKKKYIILERKRETKRKREKRDGREDRETIFYIFLYYLIGLYVKIRTEMLSILLNGLVK